MSRNQKTLMIGGALILIALLLVCGPLTGRFGGPEKVAEPPSVAAGPPAGAGVAGAGAVGAAAAGAIAGAGVGEGQLAAAGAGRLGEDLENATERCRRRENETDEEWRSRLEQIENEGGFDEDCARWAADSGYVGLAGAAAAGLASTTDAAGQAAGGAADTVASDATRGAGRAAAGVAGAGAAIAAGTASTVGSGSGSAGSGSGAVLSAGAAADLPLATIAGGDVAAGLADKAGTAALAVNAFDSKLASVGAGPPDGELAGPGVGMAGKVVNRFAPPVAAPGGGGYDVAAAAQPFGVGKGSALQPCDNPGSGCRNLTGIPSNPPIVPGVRPPAPANPPIIPGSRPAPPVVN